LYSPCYFTAPSFCGEKHVRIERQTPQIVNNIYFLVNNVTFELLLIDILPVSLCQKVAMTIMSKLLLAIEFERKAGHFRLLQ